MKITYQQMEELHSALLIVPFKTEALLNVAENINKLKVHLDSILTMKNKLIRQLTGGEETIGSNHKNWTKFVTEYNKVIVQEVELAGITKIKKESIDLANAPTPPEGKKINLQGFIATLLAFNVLE